MNTDSKIFSTQSVGQDDDTIDLVAWFLVLLRGWKIILLLSLLTMLIGILYSRSIKPTFESDALVQIHKSSGDISSAVGFNLSGLVSANNNSPAQTEAELIKSRMVLKPVVELLHLDIRLNDPLISAFDRIKGGHYNTQINAPDSVRLETSDGQAQITQFNVSQDYLNQSFQLVKSETGFTLSNGLDDFKGKMNTPYRFKGAEGIIEITVNDLPSNKHPVNITKQVLQATTDSINDSLSVKELGGGTGIIELTLTGPNQKQTSLILSHIIQSYIAKNESYGSEKTKKTIEFMKDQLPLLKQKLERSEAIFNSFRTKNGIIDVSREAELLLGESSKIETQLNELKLKKADLTTYYTEEHPLILQINEQFKLLNDRKNEITDTIEGMPEVQRESLTLSQNVSINREVYLTLLKKYEELKVVEAGQTGYARVIDLPVSNYKVVDTKKRLIVMIFTILGTMLGVLLVLIKDLLRKVVKDADRLEAKIGIPVIATIPRSSKFVRLVKSKNTPTRLLTYVDNKSSSYEAIKRLRTNIMLGMLGQKKADQCAEVILITSESAAVGKSFITANLAEVFSQLDKKVLVIDADLHLGELHKFFNVEQYEGLADYLSEPRDVSDNGGFINFIKKTSIDNIDYIPKGKQTANFTSLLASDRFSNLMAELNNNYDYIIIDSAPILATSDTMVLTPYATNVLMVTKYNSSLEKQLVDAVKQMNRANLQVDGIIINDVHKSFMSRYGYKGIYKNYN